MTLRAGTLAGGYEFIDVLDSSPTGVTYKVRNVLAQRYETLKVLPKTLQEDPEKLERFLREVKIQARISHPNIAQFYNAVQLDGHYLMTTEVIEGVTLQSRLEIGPLPVEEAVHWVLQALSALEYAHALGVVHRGITPSSLMITHDGVLKLTSFDVAKSATDPKLTQAGIPIGPVKYMSPEQVKGMENPDARSDIYSLGAVLYELVTGVPPFEADSQFDLMLAQVSKTPRAPSEVNPAVPKSLDPVILAALAKEPSHRFKNAGQFSAELEKWRTFVRTVRSVTSPMAVAPGGPMPSPSQSGAGAAMASGTALSIEEYRYLGIAAAAVVVVLVFYAISGFAR